VVVREFNTPQLEKCKGRKDPPKRQNGLQIRDRLFPVSWQWMSHAKAMTPPVTSSIHLKYLFEKEAEILQPVNHERSLTDRPAWSSPRFAKIVLALPVGD